MALFDRLKKNESMALATATLATLATHSNQASPTVAKVASVAVANSQNEKTDTDSETRYWRYQVTDASGITSISHVAWLTLAEMQSLCPNATVTPLDDPKPQTTGMTANDEKLIRQWLAHIGEINPENIDDVLRQCKTDTTAFQYFLLRAHEIPQPIAFDDDDRRHCHQCKNLAIGGRCLAAARGEMANAGKHYKPADDIPRRCLNYAPKANDPDQRAGMERWPMLREYPLNKKDENRNLKWLQNL